MAEPVVKDTKCENDRRYDTAEPINYICKTGQHLEDPGNGRASASHYFKNDLAALIVQSTSVTKPAMNDLPFAADGREIEEVWLLFL